MNKNYNTSIGDVIPYIIANAFCIRIYIIDMTQGKQLHCVKPDTPHNASLVIHRMSDHYSGVDVIPGFPTFVPSSPVSNPKAYSSSQLRALHSPAPSISRPVRKQLFQLQLWCPKTNHPAVTPVFCSGLKSLPTTDLIYQPSCHVSCALVNTRSIRNKVEDFLHHVQSKT